MHQERCDVMYDFNMINLIIMVFTSLSVPGWYQGKCATKSPRVSTGIYGSCWSTDTNISDQVTGTRVSYSSMYGCLDGLSFHDNAGVFDVFERDQNLLCQLVQDVLTQPLSSRMSYVIRGKTS